MTVQTNTNSIAYVGNGSTVHFDYDFLILDASHLKVYFGDALQTSGYVVSGVLSQTGGTVAFAVAPPNGTEITLTRSVPFLQLTDYQPYDAFPAESHERALDLLTMMAQQLKDASDRSMQYPVGGNKWDAKGNEIINVGTGNSGTSAANVNQVRYLIASEVGNDPSASASVRAREALRRSYAGVGFNLVDGSFEVGGTLVNANDVLLQERTGKAFSGPAGVVAAGTNPERGGFVDVSERGYATFDSVAAMKKANLSAGTIVKTASYRLVIPMLPSGAASYVLMTAGDYGKTADGYADHLLDNGLIAVLLQDNLTSIDQFGAMGDNIADDAPVFAAAFAYSKTVRVIDSRRTYRIAGYVGLPDQDLYNQTPYRLIGLGATLRIDAPAAPFTSKTWSLDQTNHNNPFTGKLLVDGVNFIGNAVDGVFDCDHIYDLQVKNCHFDSMNRIFISRHAKTGHPNGYIQSLTVTDNIFTEIYEGIIRAKKAYNVLFKDNLCEKCDYGLIIDGIPAEIGSSYSIHNIRLIDNLFEGGGVFARLGATIAGIATGNYFESNTRGDISIRKCHLDLRCDATVPFADYSTWVIDGNSSQDVSGSQTADTDFCMFKINGSYEYVSARGNWANSAVTISPVKNMSGNYSRRLQKYNITTSPQSANMDFKSRVFDRPLSYQLVNTNQFNVLSLQMGSDITATDFKGGVLDFSIVLKGKVETGEVFAECAFDLKLFFSARGSGVPSSKGKPTNWDAKGILSNYLEQTAGIVIDSETGAQTIKLFPAGAPSISLVQVGTIFYVRLLGFNDTANIPGYGPLTVVTTSAIASCNGLTGTGDYGSALNWISLVN